MFSKIYPYDEPIIKTSNTRDELIDNMKNKTSKIYKLKKRFEISELSDELKEIYDELIFKYYSNQPKRSFKKLRINMRNLNYFIKGDSNLEQIVSIGSIQNSIWYILRDYDNNKWLVSYNFHVSLDSIVIFTKYEFTQMTDDMLYAIFSNMNLLYYKLEYELNDKHYDIENKPIKLTDDNFYDHFQIEKLI